MLVLDVPGAGSSVTTGSLHALTGSFLPMFFCVMALVSIPLWLYLCYGLAGIDDSVRILLSSFTGVAMILIPVSLLLVACLAALALPPVCDALFLSACLCACVHVQVFSVVCVSSMLSAHARVPVLVLHRVVFRYAGKCSVSTRVCASPLLLTVVSCDCYRDSLRCLYSFQCVRLYGCWYWCF